MYKHKSHIKRTVFYYTDMFVNRKVVILFNKDLIFVVEFAIV